MLAGSVCSQTFAKLRQMEAPHIIAHKNSANFLNLELEETTSYFSVVFGEEKVDRPVYQDKFLTLMPNPAGFREKNIGQK
ncbi:unnamed protein product [marine sediment metagenome]|uniref:Uncharacterized protein n=1 Tax=marine sediment metagenome TaxID=412755 RepID=X1T6X7_9ZZZZ